MFGSTGISICAPLVINREVRSFFKAQLLPKRGICRDNDYNEQKLDTDIAILQDYGIYPAGKTAKVSYLHLLNYWREDRPWLSPPPAWEIRINGRLSCGMYDSRSSELALLLGMVACHYRLNIQYIFATGELETRESDNSLRVKPVECQRAKLTAMLNEIANLNLTGEVLLALPRRAYPNEKSAGNNSEALYSDEIEIFTQQYPYISLTVVYCDKLQKDLEACFPRLKQYPFPHPYLKWLSLGAAGLLFAGWLLLQYQQPLYLNWDNQPVGEPSVSTVGRPLRLRTVAGNKVRIRALCPASRPGDPVLAINDILWLNVRAEDNSHLKHIAAVEGALVLAGEKSSIRVEHLAATGKPARFSAKYMLNKPEEDYLVAVIARRSFPIDKGALNRQLHALTRDLQGKERLATVAGYLEHKFNVVQYRFHLVSKQACGELP